MATSSKTSGLRRTAGPLARAGVLALALAAGGVWRPGGAWAAEADAAAATGTAPAAAGTAPPSEIVVAPQLIDPTDDVGVVRNAREAEQRRLSALKISECSGTDLVKALQASDPASFEQFEAAARGVVNGQGLLWRVDRPGGRVSYLFGTMHSSDALAKNFDELVTRALARSQVVAIELPGASTRRVAVELRRLVANRSFRAGGGTLGMLPAHERPAVEARIARAGIPPQVADQLNPWFLALSLSRSTCGSPAAGTDTETADARIERLAHEQGSEVVALETPLEQVDALAAIPDGVALRMVQDATAKGMRPEDIESTISGLYQNRRIGYLLAMRGPVWAGIFDVDGYADFLSAFITRRNAAMLQRALPILGRGEAFLAVGALHLPGEEGLVEMIRRSGFTVTRLW